MAQAEGSSTGTPAGSAATGNADAPFWRVYFSPYSYHWQYNPEHRPVWSVGAERQRADGWLAGGSYFRNSFDQPSAYLYAGKRWERVLGQPQLFTQFTAGLLYGYRGAYKNKVPLNYDGYSPGAVASLGWHLDRHSELTVHLLGSAAVMFQYSYNLR